MKIAETIKFFFYPLFLNKEVYHKPTAEEKRPSLPTFVHRKIHLICEGKERLKRECYYELEDMFFKDDL